MLHRTQEGCCEKDIGMSKAREPHYCEHGGLYVYTKGLGTKPQREGRRPKRSLDPGRGFAASPEQQAKVRNLACVACGKDRHETKIEAAHVCARRLAPHCDCADGVVPLCSRCHSRYDDLTEHFDLLPALVEHGYYVETVHGFTEHGVGLVELLNHITGSRYAPAADFIRELEERQARIVELEASVAA